MAKMKGLYTNTLVALILGLNLISVIGIIVQCIIYYPLLGDEIASHFNGAGDADGFMPKNSFFAIYLGSVLGTNLFFHIFGFSMSHLPAHNLNIPNKEYWLSNEDNKRKLFSYLLAFMIWIALIVSVLFFGLFQLSFSANIENPSNPHLPMMIFLPMVILFLLLMGTSIFLLIMKLRVKKPVDYLK